MSYISWLCLAGSTFTMNKPARLPDNTASLYQLQVRGIRDYAMFLMDTEGTVITWNAGVEHVLGYSEREFLGQSAHIIFTPEDREAQVPQTEMQRARQQGQTSDVRWHQRKGGIRFFANGTMQALRDPAGALLGFAKVISDETRRKLLEDALTESNQALAQFAYSVAHDLQEPLRTVSAHAQLLARRCQYPSECDVDRLGSFVVNGALRMQKLIDDLLSYSQTEVQDANVESASLDQDFEAACSQLQQSIEESQAVITHDPLPDVRGNRGQFVRLFQNLLSNAIKYRATSEPRIHVAARKEGANWVVSVSDNGIGFDPQYAEDIFRLFKRLHRDEYPGTGLGLAMCRRIVERHGGRMWAESEPGRGATFFFTLPEIASTT